jgi:hypothetical protein
VGKPEAIKFPVCPVVIFLAPIFEFFNLETIGRKPYQSLSKAGSAGMGERSAVTKIKPKSERRNDEEPK